MKKIYIVCFIICLFSGCYKEDIDHLYSEQQQLAELIRVLEEKCAEANNAVVLLKNLVNGSMVKEAKPFNEPETQKSGWEIFFTDGSSFRIYNGEKGTVPVIGITQTGGDLEGWYWTLDGELLKDANGNPLRLNGRDAMAPFINEDGFWVVGGVVTDKKAAGEVPAISDDGYWMIGGEKTTVKAVSVEPLLAIGADLIGEGIIKDKNEATIQHTSWYLSVDGGAQWVKISAAGEESCLIKSVTESEDGEKVIFELANGQQITVPSWAWAQKLVLQVNELTATLNAWVTNAKSITEVLPLKDTAGKEIGWRISYSDNTYSDIYNGKDGNTPRIGVVREGEDYLWTVNGEKLTLEGKLIKANAVRPQLQLGEQLEGVTDMEENPVEAGIWYLSVDGEHWARISGEKGDMGNNGEKGDKGDTGDAFFQKAPVLDAVNGVAIFTLSDGTEIKVALYDWVKKQLDDINAEFQNINNLLQELKDRRYITQVEEIMSADGRYVQQYKILFNIGEPLLIGNTLVGLRGGSLEAGEDAGDLYWTVNGVDLLYNGQAVKANGKDGAGAPMVKQGSELPQGTTIAGNGLLEAWATYVSFDNGLTWIRLSGDQGEKGDQGNQGDPGKDGMVVDIEEDPDGMFVTFKFGNGKGEVTVPTLKWQNSVNTQLNTLNSEITLIKEFLAEGMIVKSVTGIMEEGQQVGYSLVCQKMGSQITETYELRNGADGLTPSLSVEDGKDGNYYWLLNGELLKDNEGKKIPVNGQQGPAGQDAAVPQLRKGDQLRTEGTLTDAAGEVVDDYAIYLSIDNGAAWTKVSGPAGEKGEQGSQGEKGDSFFKEVRLSADKCWLHIVMKDAGGGVDITLDIPTAKWAEDINQRIDGMNDRIVVIEQLLQEGIIIKNIKEFDEGGRSGYDLVYTKNGAETTIKVYNGKDGKVPEISVCQDEGDGNFYWTVEGEYVLTGQGDRVRANAVDGQAGTPGQTGKDAPLPRLATGQELTKLNVSEDNTHAPIEPTAVYLSVDDGVTWVKVSGPKGDSGQDGSGGQPSDPGFTAEKSEDGNWITWNFPDNSQVKVPTEQWCNTVETQLAAFNKTLVDLQAILNTAYFIKEIKEFAEDRKTGWEIVLMDIQGQKVTPSYKLYNGLDGKDGDAGQVGSKGDTPLISVAKDTDNPMDDNLYWTVDGEFLKSDNGEKVAATGKNAPVPQVQLGVNIQDESTDMAGDPIVATFYYLSVDGLAPWYRVSGQAGEKGEQGEKGDSLIEEIQESEEAVTFKLAGGTSFQLAKYIEVTVTFTTPEETYLIDKNTTQGYAFTVEGSYRSHLSLTTIVGGNWKVLQQYDPASGNGNLVIQAPKDWDHNKIVMLLGDQKGRVWTFPITVETTWGMGDPFVDRRDERIYTVTLVNNRWWMTQDLQYGKVTGYTYLEVEAGSLCPEGWHVANDEDWADLDAHTTSAAFGFATVGGGWWAASSADAGGKVSVWTINSSKWSSEKISPEPSLLRSVRCVKPGPDLK